ncbi:GrpB family protein [uncultured Oscillibacter sp.]|uniref:GrpB family protein n=1 Tax=uncultured Oscillibacter sp. TaxID=876091 RepID=UPI00260C4D00|nr:GrpB family protein [uncultured Oscillibacter sp.]
MAEDYLKQVTVGEVEAHDGSIRPCPYDRRWPEQFRREAEKIRAALGERALAVEHVGSTSVPGFCAKPILDILLLTADADREADYVPALTAAGYALRIREPDWFQHRMLRGTDPAVNLHVFSAGCPEAARMLAFRDWLRTCRADRDRYAAEKQRLAARPWAYVQDYADAKTAVVGEILERIRQAGLLPN